METTALRDAYRTLLAAAGTVIDAGESTRVPEGEWNADQILGHIALVDAGTIAAAGAVASGANTVYDNRPWIDTWTIERVIDRAGDSAGLRERIRLQGEVLCTMAEVLSEAELDTPVPTVLVSKGDVLVDQPVPLRALIAGLAEDHLPKHTQQMLALLSEKSRTLPVG